MTEVDAMGFANFQHIPEWIVNQEIYMYLATKFDLENNVIKDDVANIEINAEIVEHALGLPFLCEYEALKSRWGKFSLADLKGFVIKCALQIEEERMLFREAFILFLGKTSFCPTTNSFLSPERHFPLVVDVKNPMQYNWSLQIFTWIKDTINDFQKKGVKHLSACMFVVVVIYFQRLKWGRLDRCRSPEPWIIDRLLTNLEHRATTVLKKIINLKIKEFNNRNFPRFTNEFYCVESGILDTILIDRNLVAYEIRGEYFGMNPNLGIDKETFDKEKATTRQ
ncbi:hypothetical protein PIB30_066494 [Stylosanthes scabra]|uniref:Uncharacterized protein n=1 Tax=Stylosanthes scabra TaxID=79078 RepID=A0ABU6RMD7_9FABA|nr:hypothetical protein [Stylosanthes scabra]